MHINTYFVVTGWMLCVIPLICKYAEYNLDSDNRKKVSNTIRILFHGLSEYEIDFNLDLFWTE